MSVENGSEPGQNPNFQAQQPAEVKQVGTYDHLLGNQHGDLDSHVVAFDGGDEGIKQDVTQKVEAAAVREAPKRYPDAQTSARPGYWTPPTAEQSSNAARYGFDLTKQEKYHSKDAWSKRG